MLQKKGDYRSWLAERVVMLLLQTGKVDVDAKDKDGSTALSVAEENEWEVIAQLLRNKVNAAEETDCTPPFKQWWVLWRLDLEAYPVRKWALFQISCSLLVLVLACHFIYC